jgi:hypothetical protein
MDNVTGVPQNVVCVYGAVSEKRLKTTDLEVKDSHRKLEILVQSLPIVSTYSLIPE